MSKTIHVDGISLTIGQVIEIAREFETVKIAEHALENVERGRNSVENVLKSGKTVYGINTGFGKFAEVKIKPNQLRELQLNLIRSHAVGTGAPLVEEETRAVMLVRLNTLLKGNSGVRSILVAQIESALNRKLYPYIPRYGSLGASGDLVPSAHLALCLVGEGYAFENGRKIPAKKALSRIGVSPINLREKEGLALINGTQVMTGLGCLLVEDSERLFLALDIAAALTLEGVRGSVVPYDERLQRLRPHKGQVAVASMIRKLTKGSSLVGSSERVQDAYSLRCVPQVHGAFHDVLEYARSVIELEMDSVTDNPIVVLEDDSILVSGNFHGQPIALALDFLCAAVAEAAVFSERRIDKLLSGYNPDLPVFLSTRPGFCSGLMVTQYTASALISQNRVLARPASLDNATVSAGQEDHASMGVTSALKCRDVLENTFEVIAIEMICAAQAIDLLGAANHLGTGTRLAYKEIRKLTQKVKKDRSLSADIMKLATALKKDQIQLPIKRYLKG